MKIFYIDLFSGAGGTTTGIHLTNQDIEVVACVNHDAKAIQSHKANHPKCLHFTEDVRDMKVVIALQKLVKNLRRKYPDCIINLWASLECTNYSKAKGGLPRDADSRTLAQALYEYIDKLKPEYLTIENVREFMSWGPLDKNGKPISRLKGRDYIKWIDKLKSFGYSFDSRLLDSADYGAYTSRIRYFCQFAKDDLPILWPEPTHSKKLTQSNLFRTKLKPWKPVREVLDLNDHGQSIFNRKKPLVEASLKRIYAGLIKFVAGGEDQFLIKYNSMNNKGVYVAPNINNPSPVVSTQGRLGLATVSFIQKHFSGDPKHKVISIDKPTGSLTTKCHQSIASIKMLTSYYGNTKSAQDINQPCPTITTKDRFSAVFIDQQYGNSRPVNLKKPIGALTKNPKFNIVHANWLLNPQYKDKGRSLDKPCFTLIAKMDKKPPQIVQAKEGVVSIVIYKNDSPMTVKIKEFMALYGIIDITIRMLKIIELLRIQGFPENYILYGNQSDQKKFIGNAVVPIVAKVLAETNILAIKQYLKRAS